MDTLRGRSTEGSGQHGHRLNKVEDWGIYLPANSTLRSYLPYVNPYEGIPDSSISKAALLIKECCENDLRGRKTAGWMADEIEIRAGMVHRNGGLIGRVHEFVLEKVSKFNWEPAVARAQLATHILQLFISSTDGTVCLLIGYIPTRTITGKEMTPLVRKWIALFSREGVDLAWGATDGFRSNHTFVTMMSKVNPTYTHFFDYVHLLKNFRNLICNRVVKSADCPTGFHITDLVTLRSRSVNIKVLLPLEPNPTDKMEMKSVSQLMTEKFLEELGKENEPALKGLHSYFTAMRKFFVCFDDITLPYSRKLAYISEAEKYFQEIQNFSSTNCITKNLYHQFVTSCQSFKKIHEIVGNGRVLTSQLGTNTNENFFSLVRQKIRYPSLWDYGCYYSRARMEFIKRNADDSRYHYRKANISKKYNNQKNLHYVLSDINLLSKADRSRMKAEWVSQRSSKNPSDLQLCDDVVAELGPCRKRMLIREATCKENPTKKVKVAVRTQIPCPLYSSCGHKPYVNPQSLVNHLLTVHPREFPSREAGESHKRLSEAKQIITQLAVHPESTYKKIPINPQPLIDDEEGDESCDDVDLQKPPEDDRQVNLFVVDTETNGFKGPIVEIFVRNVCNEKTFGALIKPFDDQPMSPEAIKIHGITDQQLSQGEEWSYVVEDLLTFVRECEAGDDDTVNIFVAHNMEKFDKQKILDLFNAAKMEIPAHWHFVDSLQYCHYLDSTKGSFSLRNLFMAYCPNQTFLHHRAEDDTNALWKVMISMTQNIFGSSYDAALSKVIEFYLNLISGKQQPIQIQMIAHKWTYLNSK
eukprot:Pompholyxophrys_punicea_v1_NODE_46_length_4478_cov_10.250283.p1 type:complete len:811 gc:universal NODE_46_length_4478_cov_10.250283:1622-4054(+)